MKKMGKKNKTNVILAISVTDLVISLVRYFQNVTTCRKQAKKEEQM